MGPRLVTGDGPADPARRRSRQGQASTRWC